MFFVNFTRDMIYKEKSDDVIPVVLCANKSDLVAERQVSEAEGQHLAWELQCPYMFQSLLKIYNSYVQ